MALRFARGLFRLWLILSVLWIGGVGVVTWLSLPSAPFRLQRSEARPSQCEGVNNFECAAILKQLGRCTGPSQSEWCRLDDEDVGLVDHPKRAWRTVAAIALLPPALVLVIGSALVWAFRGFR